MLKNDKVYRFADITVDGENFRVQKGGQNIALTPRAFDVLAYLITHPQRVLDKQEIFESVWKDSFVGDNALTKVIKEIRHALDDSVDQPRYIETVPKRGYRFIGEVQPSAATPEFAATQTEQTTNAEVQQPSQILPSLSPVRRFAFSKGVVALMAIGLIAISALAVWLVFRQKSKDTSAPFRSIAVLPFKSLTAENRDESLELGMADTLITRLSNLKQVAVRPMSAVRKYTDPLQDPVKAGQEVQAEAVLDGSLQKAGERIRVTVRLISVRNGETLWSEQFDENFTDIFKVQDSIAQRVTNALTLQLSQQEQVQLAKHWTDNPEAYQLYLRGQLTWHRRKQNWIDQSLSYYQQALQKDPNFALAHIGAADCYIMLSGHRRISMPEAETRARPFIMKALEIDGALAQAHNALAELKYQYEYDWSGAEKEFERATDLNPNIAWIHQAFGWFLMSEGRFDEATREMEKARALDPSSLTINAGRGRLFYYSRQYDQAIQQFQNIVAVEPDDSSSYDALYNIYQQKQQYPEAVEYFLKARSFDGQAPKETEELREAFRVSGWQGFLRKRLEVLEDRARNDRIAPVSFADLYVRLGDKDKAFAWLEKSFAAREPGIIQFKIEPAYDSLRDDTRYVQLLRQIGLQP